MAYDFPTTPANGTAVTTPAGATFIWDGVKWSTAKPAAGSIVTDDTPPAAPVDGTLWWDSVSGNLYVYYDDGSSTQWVPATVPGGASLTEPVGAGTWGRLATGVWERSVALAGDTMTGNLTIIPGGGWPSVLLDRAAGTSAQLIGMTANTSRWIMNLGDSVLESGANAGSNFSLGRFDDAGGFIDSPLSIIRATGVVDFTKPPTVAGILPYVLKVGDTMTGSLSVSGYVAIYGPAASGRDLVFKTNTLTRWLMTADLSAETGGNAGSDFRISRWDDAGAVLMDYPLTISRASGDVNFTGKIYTSGNSIYANSGDLGFYDDGVQCVFKWTGAVNDYFVKATGERSWSMDSINRIMALSSAGLLYTSGGITTDGNIKCQLNSAGIGYFSGVNSTSMVFLFGFNSIVPGLAHLSIDGGSVAYAIGNGSDARIKLNIADTTFDALATVNQLQLREFDWLKLDDPGNLAASRAAAEVSDLTPRVRIGLVAQEVNEVFPEGVYRGDDSADKLGLLWGLDANVMLGLLVGAVQQLTARIAALEAA